MSLLSALGDLILYLVARSCMKQRNVCSIGADHTFTMQWLDSGAHAVQV